MKIIVRCRWPAPESKDEPRSFGSPGGIRHRIESVRDTLEGQLGLERHSGRTRAGRFARIVRRVLAMAAAIGHKWATGAISLRSLPAFDH
jgi:hypothetical protein